jgi:2',3'-cyclic-nucleotide 2'-phosphodiesterase (5'-nucleotidase family)
MKRTIRKGILLLLAVLLMLSAGSSAAADAVIFGDADGDSELTAQDASTISRHLAGFRRMDAAALTRADVDGDGVITERDASMILGAFMTDEPLAAATASFSFLVTSDLNGNAWNPAVKDQADSCTAMNVAACAAALREQEPGLLLFDAGGSIFGSAIADEYAQRSEKSYGPITSLFIRMQYDAVLLGDEAMSYPSQTVRREVNELLYRKIPVLGANLQKADPTVFDPAGVLWNELVPYRIFEIPQGEETDEQEPLRIALIGMTQPDLCPSDDEVLPADPLETYAKLRKELKGKADYTVLLWHGNLEVDTERNESYSLRDLLKRTDSIDLVLVSHGKGTGVRAERNSVGAEIPIVPLKGGVETVTRVDVSLREKGRPAVCIQQIDTRGYAPDASIQKVIKPYVSAFSGMMDAVVCTVEKQVDASDPNALSSSDGMDLIHELQLYTAEYWIDENEIDLPRNVISVAYPYIRTCALREGALTYRDLCAMKTEMPHYTLLLIRGSELRAWLNGYAGRIMADDTVYSLYGLSYLLNTMNEAPQLGFLEHSSGLAVEDDEVFTLILAEKTDGDSGVRACLDAEWMAYEDRVVEGLTLPEPWYLRTLGEDPLVDALAAFLESVGTLHLEQLYHWIVI